LQQASSNHINWAEGVSSSQMQSHGVLTFAIPHMTNANGRVMNDSTVGMIVKSMQQTSPTSGSQKKKRIDYVVWASIS